MSDSDHELKPGDDSGVTIDELAERCGVSVRAIRFYIAQGLLPGPGSRGKSATYGEEHLERLRLIRQLSERHVPLAKIQALLQGLSLDDVKALQVAEQHRSAQLEEAERRQSPQSYVAALLEDARQARQKPLPHRQQALDTSMAPVAEAQRLSAPRAPAQSQGDFETWYRWTLAPGIELHVSADARARFQTLLRRVLRAAGAQEDDARDK